jgi:arsenate reductase (glutaredoxin)
LAIANELGVEFDVIEYMKAKPDRELLQKIVAILEDPVADLVRKDSVFAKLGLDANDYVTADAVVDLLVAHPKLLQRPVVMTATKAIIGRPKDRVRQLLS